MLRNRVIVPSNALLHIGARVVLDDSKQLSRERGRRSKDRYICEISRLFRIQLDAVAPTERSNGDNEHYPLLTSLSYTITYKPHLDDRHVTLRSGCNHVLCDAILFSPLNGAFDYHRQIKM